MNALLKAAHDGHEACVRVLIAAQANVAVLNHVGSTSLHLATYKDHASICRILVDEGASLTIVNRAGKTPLEMAQAKGNVECEAILAAPEELATKVITGTATRGFRFAVTKAAGEQAPPGLDKQIYDAAGEGKHDELLGICQEWAGHAVIDAYKDMVSQYKNANIPNSLTHQTTPARVCVFLRVEWIYSLARSC